MVSTRARIEVFIAEKFPLARKRLLATDDSLLASGIVDSLGILDLVGFLEQEFGIVVADEDLTPENFQNSGTLAQFVQQKLDEAAAPRQ